MCNAEIFEVPNQFLLTQASGDDDHLQQFCRCGVGSYSLYTSESLKVTNHVIDQDCEIVIVGIFYHHAFSQSSSAAILSHIGLPKSLDGALPFIKQLSGVFLAVVRFGRDVFVVPDACAMRECFVGRDEIAFSPKLLTSVIASSDPIADDYYRSIEFARSGWIGAHTNFAGISRLRPNHYMRLGSPEMHRFFPLVPRKDVTIDVAARDVTDVLVGTFEAVVQAEKIMVGLTAGWDSRVLLAASRRLSSRIQYYLLCHANATTDVRISRAIAREHGLNYFQQWYSTAPPTDDEIATLRDALGNFNPPSSALANFARFHNNRLSVSGACAEIARVEFGKIRNLTARILAGLAKQCEHPFVLREYSMWLETSGKHIAELGYEPLDFFYWEQVVANKTAKTLAESQALGLKIFPVFNNHAMLTTMLGVPERFRQKQHNLLYLKIVNELWPELMKFPINPHPKKIVINILQRAGVYDFYRTMFPIGVTRTIASKRQSFNKLFVRT